jgi:hypothetical protein
MQKPRLVVPALALVPALAAQGDPPPPAPKPTAAAATPVTVGEGAHRYTWVAEWGRSPDGKDVGSTHGCMVIDRKGRVLVNTETEQAVLIFSPAGELLGSWGKEFKGGLHGMCLRTEDGQDFLYLAHTNLHEALKATLDGKVVWTIGWPKQAGIYEKEEQFKPTAIAVAPDGRIFVADGYGKWWVHAYDKDRNYVKSFGGPGKAGNEPGKMNTPHGLWIDTRGKEPLLLVCDRANGRLQWFTLDGTFVRMMDQGLHLPCNVWPLAGGELAVADLKGRVTILDKDDKVVLHLGDNADGKLQATNQVGKDLWRAGTFFAPHSVCADAAGNLYVMDWNLTGRLTKLVKTGG